MAKSTQKQTSLVPGTYKGRWGGYEAHIEYDNGKVSQIFETDEGVRGINCKCTIEVKEDGTVYIN
jgi:hypothetical protein